jgi:hypothetical protein
LIREDRRATVDEIAEFLNFTPFGMEHNTEGIFELIKKNAKLPL